MVRPRPCVFVVFVLSAALAATAEQKPAGFPDEPPQAPPLRPATMPAAFSETLDNGMEVVVVQSDEVPYVSIAWYLMAGSRFDPPDKTGLATMTADLLRQGTANYTADRLASRLDFHAVKLAGSANHEYTEVSAGCLSQFADLAVEMLAEVIRRPTFPREEFARRIKEAIDELSVRERDPGYQAERSFREIVYGPHYQARPSEGTTKTLRAISVDDLAQFHRAHYMPNRSLIIFSGSIAPPAAAELARKYFGGWEPGTSPAEPDTQLPPARGTHVYLVDRPGAEQSQIRVGHIGIRRTDPAYVASRVFNQFFGGGFNSRLNRRIRIQEGLTYGARGSMSAGKEPGVFLVSTFTRTEKTAETASLVLEEVKRALAEPPTKEELSESISYLNGQFGLSLETPIQVAGKVFELRFYGLPDEYFAEYLTAVNGIDADAVLAFARESIHPDQLVIVVVGDAETIHESLKQIAPVTVIEQGRT